MSSGHTRPASRRQAELDDWLNRAAVEGVTDLASLRGTMRAPTNLLQQLAEAVLDSSVSILPDGGLPHLRQAWSEFEAQQGRSQPDPEQGMSIVADPLAACVAVILGGAMCLIGFPAQLPATGALLFYSLGCLSPLSSAQTDGWRSRNGMGMWRSAMATRG